MARPGFAARFLANYDDAHYTGTLRGTGNLNILRDAVEFGWADDDMLRDYNKAKAEISYSQMIEPAESWTDYSAAVLGQIAGSIATPESILSAPLRLGGMLAKAGLAPAASRITEAGVQGAITNTAIDPAVQQQAIKAGVQDEFEVWRTAMAPVTGLAGGVALSSGVEGVRVVARATLDRIIGRAPTPAGTEAPVPDPNAAPTPGPASTAPGTGAAVEPPGLVSSPVGDAVPGAVLQSEQTYRVKVTDLQTDPARFQYKSGGDQEGVTAALKGIDRFDEAKAGRIIVYQPNSGELIVADGHQRTGLARRLIAAGKEPADLGITALVYREADGYKPEDVRAIAAAANLATGTGSAIDAAKVLRSRPDLADGSLPPNSTLVRDAKGLAKLSDEAFGMVVNDVVPDRYGAMVGQAFPDPEMQGVAMRAIAKMEPSNADEAAVLLERIKVARVEKAETEAQGTFFDNLMNEAESTVIEETKIVARALRRLRTDATLFRGAVRKADRLEEAGSTIEREASQSAADDAARAAFITEKAFDTAGDIRSSLTDLAAKVKRGEKGLAEASFEFAAAVKQSQQVKGDGGSPQAKSAQLIVASRAPDGTITYGEPGQIHAELLFANDIDPNPKIAGEMGFATAKGEPFMTRREASEYVAKNDPARAENNIVNSLAGGLEAAQYFRPPSRAPIDDEPGLFGAPTKMAALAVRRPGAATIKKLAPTDYQAGLVVAEDRVQRQLGQKELIQRSPQDRTVDELVGTVAPKAQAELSAAAKAIADEIGAELMDPGPKTNKARILEKIASKGYRTTAQLTDLARLGFVVKEPFDGAAIANKLAEKFLVLDEGWSVNGVGYMDRKLLVQFPDGLIGEVQIWSPKMIEAKEKLGGHGLYEQARSLPEGDPRIADLEQGQFRLYSAAVAEETPRWRDAYAEAAGASSVVPGIATPKPANSFADTTNPLSRTSTAETGVQPSPSARTATAEPSGNMAAGRPSQANSVGSTSVVSLDDYRAPSPTGQDMAEFGQATQKQALVSGLTGQQQRPTGGVLTNQRAAAIDVEGLRAQVERLATALDLPSLRQGHLMRGAHGTRVMGQYDPRTGSTRLREIDDFVALSHEAGHHIEARWGSELAPLLRVNANRREVAALDYDPARGNVSEGFAEFFRLYVTNPQFAQTQAPTFFPVFDSWIRANRPEVATDLDAARAAYNTWLTAPSGAVIEAGLSTSFEPTGIRSVFRRIKTDGLRNTIATAMSNFYTASIDEKNPIYKAVRRLAAIHMENTGQRLNLRAVDDTYKLSRLSVDAYNAGHLDAMHGVHGFRSTDPEGPSLREAIVEATGAANAFGAWDKAAMAKFNAYLVSRRAIFEYGRYERGEIPHVPTAETKGDHEVNVRELEASNPAFVTAAAKVHEWTRNFLRKERDAGLISETQYQQALQISDYVPFMRDMSDKEPGAGSGGDRNLRQSIMQRFRGSSRPIIPPLESLMKRAYDTNILIAQNEVIRSLDRLAMSAGNGSSAIAERIPNHVMKRTQVDPVEAFRNAAREQGIDPVDADAMVKQISDLLGDDARASVFRLGDINEAGEPIVFFWEGGQRKALRLADGDFGREMFTVLTGMPKHMRDIWVNTVAAPATVLRYGITTSPDFLLANYLRDQMSAWILTEGYIPFYSGARGIVDEVAQRDIGRIHSLVGGISGGANVAALRDARINKDINALARDGWLSQKLPTWNDSHGLLGSTVRGVASIAETSETGTRLGVFRAAFDRSKREGLDDWEAAIEAAFYARDLIDFGRHGAQGVAAMRLIPFFNAALQGLDKANRTLFAPAAKHLSGRTLTKQDEAELGNSMKAWGKLAALSLLSMGLRAIYYDDPDFDEGTEYIRATHWIFKLPGNDKVIRIPKPFELAIPLNFAERMFEHFALNDPKAVSKFVKSIFEVTSPPNPLTTPLIKIPVEVTTNTNLGNISLYQMLTGKGEGTRPIVPNNLQGLEPWLQYTHRTSVISKALGEAVNVSPAVLDHVIFGFTGSWGRGILALTDQASDKKGERGWEDTFITRRFMWNVSRGSASTTQFWELIGKQNGELERKSLSYKAMIDQGRLAEAAEHLAKLDDDQRAFVSLTRSSNFDADTKRLHPLRRARDATEVLSAMRREVAFGNLREASSNEPIAVTRSQKRTLDDAMSHVAMIEARNALVVTGTKGWTQRQVMNAAPSYDVIESINPAVAQELRTRYANAKVHTFEAVRRNWQDAKRRLITDGSEAELSDLKQDMKSDGYEFGETRQRKAKQLYTVPGRAGAQR